MCIDSRLGSYIDVDHKPYLPCISTFYYIITHDVILLQCTKLTSTHVYRLLRFVTGIVAFIIVQLGVVTAWLVHVAIIGIPCIRPCIYLVYLSHCRELHYTMQPNVAMTMLWSSLWSRELESTARMKMMYVWCMHGTKTILDTTIFYVVVVIKDHLVGNFDRLATIRVP